MNLQDDFNRFKDILTAMADMKQKSLTAFVIQMYWDDLKQYSWKQFSQAATHIRRSHIYKTFPDIAVFVQAIDPPENLEAIAIEALKRYQDLSFKYGCGESLVLIDDPAMVCTLNNLGGWIKVGTEERDKYQRGQFERDFKKMYAYHRERKTKPESLKLMGYYERDNRLGGYLKSDNTDFDGSEWFPIYVEGVTALNRLPNNKTIAPSQQIENYIKTQISGPAPSMFGSLIISTTRQKDE